MYETVPNKYWEVPKVYVHFHQNHSHSVSLRLILIVSHKLDTFVGSNYVTIIYFLPKKGTIHHEKPLSQRLSLYFHEYQ